MRDKIIADMILEGASIFCGEKLPKDYDFVAVKGNRIIATGYEAQKANYIGEDTRVLKLDKENLIVPGLHDNHIHLIQAGMLDKYADLSTAPSQEEAAKTIAEFAKTIPDETWVMGFGWSRMSWEDKSLPTKESLDRYIADRPVFLLDSELHGAWVNTKALEICGIDENTQDPPFGEIAKDDQGKPSGYLYETALCLVGEKALDFDDRLVEDLIDRYSRNAIKWGITSISDMTPYLGLDLAYEETYYRMDREGKLKIRINAARNLFEDIDKFNAVRAKAEASGTGMYRVPYMKQFVDGVIANYTALLLDDYCDRPGDKGSSLLDLDKLKEAVEIAHENNVSVRLHGCGEGAVQAALDAYEHAILKAGRTEARHQIEHIESIDPSDIVRFGAMDVIASVQPEHIISGIPSFADNCYPELLGEERCRYTWPFKTLRESGAVLAGGSDAPVVEGDPFYGIYCGMVREHPDGTPEGGWNPQEKLTAEELLVSYTYGAAYAERRERELGTLEIGKLADIAVLDRNILAADPESIKETKVLYTIVDGKIVYEG
ncbi:amidohydrolase [Anaerovorax odorimutans]|uniref:Amidohydrolase n=1 Tax=Anaerovorax odorimutans TaxID=109327 RepID=A0ABT1RN36_9FIRM|nr:amidohydrolase [Anaerovorax odorimutans]MCQ4636603.1 amidohydrolase [Anaerovorax odorimutans]